MPGKKVYTAKNGARYTKDARGRVRFISGASPAYLAKIRKKRGKGKAKKGGGMSHLGKAGTSFGLAAAKIGVGAMTQTGAGSGGSSYSAMNDMVRGARQTGKAIRKGGAVNSRARGPARRKRRVTGGGIHSKTTVKFGGKNFKNKTTMGF